jgi:hypothetical protein
MREASFLAGPLAVLGLQEELRSVGERVRARKMTLDDVMMVQHAYRPPDVSQREVESLVVPGDA